MQATASPYPRRFAAPLLALLALVLCGACGTDRGSTKISDDTRRWVSSRSYAASVAQPASAPIDPSAAPAPSGGQQND